MNIKEKASYIKGLIEGMELDETKKETKLLKAMLGWMEETSESFNKLEKNVDGLYDQMDLLDEDLATVEDEVFGEDSCCECDGDCDDSCTCGCHDDENYYEVMCPECGEKICLAEETLLDEDMDCPRCGHRLEFSLSDESECRCGADCGCDDDCCPDCGCEE